MSDAIIGYGITYEILTAASGSAYTELGEVFDIELPSDEVEEIDVTHYGSPARTRETIAGLIATGEAGFTINWIPGNPTDVFLRGLRMSGETRTHRITFPDGTSVSFPGFIKGYKAAVPVDDRLTAEFTVKKAAAETWAPAGTP